MKLGSGFSFLSVALCDRPPTLLTLCCPDLQDGSPAGTIFAEDIEDVKEDYEESQKDSSKVFLTPSSHTVTTPEHFTHTHTPSPTHLIASSLPIPHTVNIHSIPSPNLQYGFVFKILTKGRDYVFNAVSNAKRVRTWFCTQCYSNSYFYNLGHF